MASLKYVLLIYLTEHHKFMLQAGVYAWSPLQKAATVLNRPHNKISPPHSH